MATVQNPPDWKEIFSRQASEVSELLRQFRASDDKGRYLHWHEFRRRVPREVEPELAWCAVKLSRLGLLKALTLKSADGRPFFYGIPDALQDILHRIDRLASPLLDSNDSVEVSHEQRNQYLVATLTMEEAISSSQLEGAATTRVVAMEMLKSERAPRSEDERMIVNNYRLMQEAVRARHEPLSQELMLRFHELAVTGTENPHVLPGQLRQTDDVLVVDQDGEVVHRPPPFKELRERLEALCEFANTEHDGQGGRPFIHPAVKAIILHFMLGYEHPFADGNGRTARALFYWFMLKQGYWAFEYISISALLKEAPVQYGLSYLYAETDEGDLTYFIDYQLRIIKRAIDDFLAHLERKRQEYYDAMGWLERSGIREKLNYRQCQLLAMALRQPGGEFIAKHVKNEFGVTENTARADLNKLAALKILVPHKEGKTIRYFARADAGAARRHGRG